MCKVFFFLYCLANCIGRVQSNCLVSFKTWISKVFFKIKSTLSTAYCLIVIDQGKAFFHFMPQLAPILTIIIYPFSCVENVAYLKV